MLFFFFLVLSILPIPWVKLLKPINPSLLSSTSSQILLGGRGGGIDLTFVVGSTSSQFPIEYESLLLVI
uniref:Secreted protein n=1 Tax=Phakopsora pachyrhizi TaxID=170000 RepID=A0A0S1MI91_PHAPC